MSLISELPIKIGGQMFGVSDPPRCTAPREDLGLILGKGIEGKVLHRWEPPIDHAYEVRATITPGGDYLLAVCAGSHHYGDQKEKVNDLIAYRSSDKGSTWTGGSPLWEVPYNQHGFLPLIPRGSRRIYAIATEPHPDHFNGIENAAIAVRHSDDDGYTWTAPRFISPLNDPGFQGMSVIRPCETERGTWLIGSHTGSKYEENKGENGVLAEGESKWTTRTRQYILRSEDRGESWEVLPKARPGGWFVPKYDRMDELCPIALGGGEVFALVRTCQGRLWELRSLDDGKTWSEPRPSPLVHPDAPAMLFKLADGKTLAAFHHNRHTGGPFNHPDRSELWVSLTCDGGRTWEEPRFVLANIAAPTRRWVYDVTNVSYVDLIADGDELHLFVPHQFRQVVHLRLRHDTLRQLPTKMQL